MRQTIFSPQSYDSFYIKSKFKNIIFSHEITILICNKKVLLLHKKCINIFIFGYLIRLPGYYPILVIYDKLIGHITRDKLNKTNGVF